MTASIQSRAHGLHMQSWVISKSPPLWRHRSHTTIFLQKNKDITQKLNIGFTFYFQYFVLEPFALITACNLLGIDAYNSRITSVSIEVQISRTMRIRSSLHKISPILFSIAIFISFHIFSIMLISGDCAGQVIVVIPFSYFHCLVLLETCVNKVAI